MDKQEFKLFCHDEFTKRGFKKHKAMYYLSGADGILCGLWLKKSSFGPAVTVMFYFFVEKQYLPPQFPTHTEYDLVGYIKVMSKDTVKGKNYMTGSIAYECYTREELAPYFDEAFKFHILPPLQVGKSHIINNNKHLTSHHTRSKEDIIEKLQG